MFNERHKHYQLVNHAYMHTCQSRTIHIYMCMHVVIVYMCMCMVIEAVVKSTNATLKKVTQEVRTVFTDHCTII